MLTLIMAHSYTLSMYLIRVSDALDIVMILEREPVDV